MAKQPRTKSEYKRALERAEVRIRRATGAVVDAAGGSAAWNKTLSECLQTSPSALRDEYRAACDARDELERGAVAAGHAWRSPGFNLLNWN